MCVCACVRVHVCVLFIFLLKWITINIIVYKCNTSECLLDFPLQNNFTLIESQSLLCEIFCNSLNMTDFQYIASKMFTNTVNI